MSDAAGDATWAAALLAVDPEGLGGAVLRGRPGPERDSWLTLHRALLPAGMPERRLPPRIGDEALGGGLDLVATLADGSGYAAIQCKFYAPNHTIQKPDIDSFISAASNDLFTRLIIADTTQKEFGKNASGTLDKLSKDWNRISISELEASRIDWSQFLRTGTDGWAVTMPLS